MVSFEAISLQNTNSGPTNCQRIACSRLSVGRDERNCGGRESKSNEDWGGGARLHSFYSFLVVSNLCVPSSSPIELRTWNRIVKE